VSGQLNMLSTLMVPSIATFSLYFCALLICILFLVKYKQEKVMSPRKALNLSRCIQKRNSSGKSRRLYLPLYQKRTGQYELLPCRESNVLFWEVGVSHLFRSVCRMHRFYMLKSNFSPSLSLSLSLSPV